MLSRTLSLSGQVLNAHLDKGQARHGVCDKSLANAVFIQKPYLCKNYLSRSVGHRCQMEAQLCLVGFALALIVIS